MHNGAPWCTKNETGPIYPLYCTTVNSTSICDEYFTNNEANYVPGIPGIMSGAITGKTLVPFS